MIDLSNEHWRHKVLTNGPLGLWRTIPGSHTQLFGESICFNTDGTGWFQTESVLSGTQTVPFVWRLAGHGVVTCKIAEPDAPPTDEVASPSPEEPEPWLRLPFVLEPCNTDVGTYWALRGTSSEGFWELTSPLVPAD